MFRDFQLKIMGPMFQDFVQKHVTLYSVGTPYQVYIKF